MVLWAPRSFGSQDPHGVEIKLKHISYKKPGSLGPRGIWAPGSFGPQGPYGFEIKSMKY